jgi:endoglucanase
MRLPASLVLLLICALAASTMFAATCRKPPPSGLGPGVNIGNALEAPNEGEWGVTVAPQLLDAVDAAGFRTVRLPVKFSAHAEEESPYRIEPQFFRRIDEILDQAQARGLTVILDMHHYDELHADPAANRERFIALWRQIATRYRTRPGSLLFELQNEPHGNLDAETWNDIAAETLAVVRESNPDRWVVIGPAFWNHPALLPELQLPQDDRRIIVTFHYYEPFQFTHQGAEWQPGSDAWLGRQWTGTPEELMDIESVFEHAAEWAHDQDRPLLLGEFGAYQKADRESRVRWTRAVRDAAERNGIAWAYWEFAAGFGLWDQASGAWKESAIRDALIAP